MTDWQSSQFLLVLRNPYLPTLVDRSCPTGRADDELPSSFLRLLLYNFMKEK